MKTSPSATGRRVRNVIVGLGKTGLSCARFLRRRGEDFAITDSRAAPPGMEALRSEMPATQVSLGGYDGAMLARADRIILSPGVPLTEPALQAAIRGGARLAGDIELFAQHADAPVIAVTGANGKSTVTTLVADMARGAGRDVRVGGNLGTPALDLLGDAPPDLYVLELSSFQLETVVSLDAMAAVVLNISPDHMDRYATLAEYAAAKRRIYRGTGIMVLNNDDALVSAMQEAGRESLRFGLRPPRSAQEFGVVEDGAVMWLARGDERLLQTQELRIPGMHNVANALAALALGATAGLAMAPMLEALRAFGGLPHRCQWVGRDDGVDWFNDSKGTNVGATAAAIVGLGSARRVVLIAGGDGKGQDFAELAEAARGRLRGAVVMGRDGPAIEAVLRPVVPVVRASDIEDAVEKAAALAQKRDLVLLSPACASFDMFRDYVHRGEAYTAAVQARLAQ